MDLPPRLDIAGMKDALHSGQARREAIRWLMSRNVSPKDSVNHTYFPPRLTHMEVDDSPRYFLRTSNVELRFRAISTTEK